MFVGLGLRVIILLVIKLIKCLVSCWKIIIKKEKIIKFPKMQADIVWTVQNTKGTQFTVMENKEKQFTSEKLEQVISWLKKNEYYPLLCYPYRDKKLSIICYQLIHFLNPTLSRDVTRDCKQ